jgi:flagellar biosynthetic protein FliR
VTWTISLDAFWAIALASVRIVALLAAAPIFGHRSVPVRIRAALALVLSVSVIPSAADAAFPVDAMPAVLAMALAREALIGVALGFATRLVFAAFALFGEFASIQGGLGAARALDPESGASSVVIGSLLKVFALMVFLAVEGHHVVIRGLAASFESLPVGAASLGASRIWDVVGLGGVVFDTAVRLAAPVTVVMMVTNVGIGILGRAIPQLNLMAVQLPALIALLLITFLLAAGPLTSAIGHSLTSATNRAVLSVLGG